MDYPITYTRKIRFSDTDAQGIVFNANYPVYWDDASTDYFDGLGIPWADMVAAGYEMVLGHLEISFRSSARLGDVLVTGIKARERGRSSIVFEARSWIEATGATVVEGELVQVFVDAEHFRPIDVPDFFLEAAARLEGAGIPRTVKGPKPAEAPPRPRVRHLEDYVTGETMEVGSYLVTEGEIISFARQYDPQAIHIDPVAAEAGPFEGIIASGWHTASIGMRALVEHFVSPENTLGSPGMDEVRWLAPVRPGDILRTRITVEKVEPSERNPHRGTVHTHIEMLNQDDTPVLTMLGRGIYLRRDSTDEGRRTTDNGRLP